MSRNFNFFVESDIEDDVFEKAKKAKGDDRYKNMILFGKASDNSVDSQDEILEPSGFDIEEFLSTGLINLEHYTVRKASAKYWIGEPIDAYVDGDEFFIKTKLWDTHPEARNLWDTIIAMKESGSSRKPGYSIEGKTMQKDSKNPKRIKKAKISHCAITFSPINKNSWVEIVKGEQKSDFIPITHDSSETDGGVYLIQMETEGSVITVGRDYSIKVDKKKAVDSETSRQLAKESLDKKKRTSLILKTYEKGLITKALAKELMLKFL